ncbi:MAG: hypothetical protein ACFFCX_07080 [Candidatus Sifarchaeia archaeon]
MSNLDTLIIMIGFFAGVLLLFTVHPRTRFSTTRLKIKRANPAPWSMSEFLNTKSSQVAINQHYYFSEEIVRSLGHRYIGRLDGAVLHWKEVPILDCVIEFKFPVSILPRRVRAEDLFQSGLYALALLESGVSCSSTMLVIVYCLQEKAKRCQSRKSTKLCWECCDGKTFVRRFKSKKVIGELHRLDEVWYNGRQPKPTRELSSCRICPYSRNRCKYSLV